MGAGADVNADAPELGVDGLWRASWGSGDDGAGGPVMGHHACRRLEGCSLSSMRAVFLAARVGEGPMDRELRRMQWAPAWARAKEAARACGLERQLLAETRRRYALFAGADVTSPWVR